MQPAPDRENLLAGLVERVTFHNEDSGFCVLRVKARGQRDLITVVGHAATIGVGEFMRASTHGVQFPPISSDHFVAQRISHLRACLPHFAQYDAFYGDCQSVWAWSAPRSANR